MHITTQGYKRGKAWSRAFGDHASSELDTLKARIFMALDDHVHELEYPQRVRLHKVLDSLENAADAMQAFSENAHEP